MKLPFSLLALFLHLTALAMGQEEETDPDLGSVEEIPWKAMDECTARLAMTLDCYDVITPIACYNQFRWNTRTLSCIDGTSDAIRARKACRCCKCVGTAMCNWVTSQNLCNSAGTPTTGKAKGKRRAVERAF